MPNRLARRPDVAPPDWIGGWHGEAMRQTAAREPSVGSDVAVPFLQALATGLLLGAPAGGLLAWLFDGPWWLAGVGALATTATAWLLLLADHRRLLWQLERLTSTDVDGDGLAGPPEPQELRLEITERTPAGQVGKVQYLTLADVSGDLLRDFAKAATAGRALTVGAWCGNGKPFTRPQYDGLMAALVSGGLATDGAGNTPRRLTAAGRAVLRKVADA